MPLVCAPTSLHTLNWPSKFEQKLFEHIWFPWFPMLTWRQTTVLITWTDPHLDLELNCDKHKPGSEGARPKHLTQTLVREDGIVAQ